ncbi:MAG: hypothetical protein ACXAB2_07370 [Candidatus Hodarchaeales archaeon]|jgi:hypothetical protein
MVKKQVEVVPKTGLIGFFDILGYQQMLLNNEVERTSHLIVDVIANIPSEVVKNLLGDQNLIEEEGLKTKQYLDKFWSDILTEEIGWLLFSDSILVSLPLDLSEDRFFYSLRFFAFLHVCAFLTRQMFDKGLPLRGALSYGDFFIQDTYFAGQPIIESYQASESLELSGCVLTKSFENILNELEDYVIKNEYENEISQLKQLCVPYLVPKKGGKLEKQCMVNWVNLPMAFFKDLPSDIREYVFSSFVEYNKDAAPIVYPKINNTETFIRKILRNIESVPWPYMSKETDIYLQNVLTKLNIDY